ncbi:transcription termination/antitermination protein NusA [Candidatus Daviesbacteria bacterium]|nr:transcription termination/antitermination protein NusA [Candidatus Daviesbacteria bacterium]
MPQARTEFVAAINQLASERGLDVDTIMEAIKAAIVAAYKKDYSPEAVDNIEAKLNPQSGEVSLTQAGKNITPAGFGRIAAQTAKQVILQRIREAEKSAILAEYEKRVGTIVNGMIQRMEGYNIYVDLGKTDALMPPSEQSQQEHYRPNQRLTVYISAISQTPRGPVVVVSRAANELVSLLFKREVPEISSGAVEIKAIAREAGARTKIAVFSNQAGVDPIGSCVGQKGVRVQAVISELGDEKIDVIAYSQDLEKFIEAALSPAKELRVKIDKETQTALVTAPDDQLSLAIGKDGQNVRLASKLTGYRIDIRGKSQSEAEEKEKLATPDTKPAKAKGTTKAKKAAKKSKVKKAKKEVEITATE